MARDEREIEARLRATLRDEAGELWPPPSLWPRVQAGLTQPAGPVPALTRPRAELQALLRRGDLRQLALALLAEREMDAFALAQRAEDIARGAGRAAPRDGTLLPALHRLELEGLLDARWLPGPQGLRRAYTLSVRGRRVRRRARLSWRLVDTWARLGRLVPHDTA
jgi:DNA-binding PadR family transcriptional regulator